MNVLEIDTCAQICEVAHDGENQLLRVRFHREGRRREDYYEFSDVPRAVFEEFQRIEDGTRKGEDYRKGEKPHTIGRYYNRTVRILFAGVRVLPNGGRVPLQ